MVNWLCSPNKSYVPFAIEHWVGRDGEGAHAFGHAGGSDRIQNSLGKHAIMTLPEYPTSSSGGPSPKYSNIPTSVEVRGFFC
jgi:hypothetical protein